MAKLTLTPQQQAVVENRGGSLLVSAAAGSGKTKVLVERLFRYMEEEHCNVDDFLIITYTKAAAAELRSKIASELSKKVAEQPKNKHLKRQMMRVYRADIKTVDAFCTALLRENTHLLPPKDSKYALTPDFRVLDDNDATLIRQRVLDRTLERFYSDFDAGKELLADTLGAGRDDRALSALVLELYNKLQSHAYPEKWTEESRKVWKDCGLKFDQTPYANELMLFIRRKAAHWAALLQQGVDRAAEDPALSSGYGEKFLVAMSGFLELSAASGWDNAGKIAERIEFPRLSTPKGRKDDPDVAALKQIWESSKEGYKKLEQLLAVSSNEAVEDLAAVAPAMLALLDLTEAFSEAYRTEKLRMNAADFSDQEHLALQLLVRADGTATELGEQIAARYTEVLVDEYQDTNEVQNAIFRAVSKQGNNVFCVGDVKQSIYRFRLADPTIFLEKYNRFASYEEAKDGEERKILLSKNFRSRREILDAANFIFENILSEEMGEMIYGEEEALHFGAEYYPERSDCQTEFHLISAHQKTAESEAPVKRVKAEARFVAKRIRNLLDSQYPVTNPDGSMRPCRAEDIVILMRSPGSRSAAFAEALAEQEIPCSFEESSEFFHTMEVAVTVSLLEILDNPHQDVPLISVLRSPVFGFTADRLAEIRGKNRKGDFYDAVCADSGEDCREFLEFLLKMRSLSQGMGVHHLVWHLYNELNLLGVFGAMDHGAERRENLIALSQHAEKFESNGYRGLFAFVSHLRKLLDLEQAPATPGASAVGGVQMMSIHKSKGLEFPIVILADLDHSFSRQDFTSPVLVHPDLGLGPQCIDLKRRVKYPTLARLAIEEKLRRENLAEEQRILYVATTRAKEKLILVSSLYSASGHLKKLAAVASCPALPEAVAAGKSFSDWILLPLLCRPEAEPLRRFADVSVESLYHSDSNQWQVFIHDSEQFRAHPKFRKDEETELLEETVFDGELLGFEYPYTASITASAKVTATQLKGRVLDDEIKEHAPAVSRHQMLKHPRFWQEQHGLTAAEQGTATHIAMQYLDFSDFDVEGQITKMVDAKKLLQEQANAIDLRALKRFLESELAETLRGAREIRREFPFMQLIDANTLDRNAGDGEQVLLQGVIDCFYEDCDGLVVIDFKTDRVFTEELLRERIENYRIQLETYSKALEIIFEKPVSKRILYFLSISRAVEL